MSPAPLSSRVLRCVGEAVWAATAIGAAADLALDLETLASSGVGVLVALGLSAVSLARSRRADPPRRSSPRARWRAAARELLATVAPASLFIAGVAIAGSEDRPGPGPVLLGLVLGAFSVRSALGRSLEAGVQHELGRQASRDELTGLLNRRAVLQCLEQSHRFPAVDHGPAVLLLDLDGFKGINDLHGHKAGDHVLRTVARRLGAAVDPADAVARLGGDEFLIVVHGGDPHALAMKVRESVVLPLDWQRFSLKVGCSVGVANHVAANGVELSGDRMLERADQALYRAKDLGGNVVVDVDLEEPVCGGDAPASRAAKRSAKQRTKLGVG